MTDTLTISLPVPRIVTGERAGSIRAYGPEAVGVVDDVPMPVRAVDGSRAPLVLRLGEGRTWHAFEGALYSPLFETREGGATPDAAHAVLLQRAGEIFSMATARKVPGETVIDYHGTYREGRVSANKPLAREDTLRMRSVLDRGIPARDAIVAGVIPRLLLVDGILMHRSARPHYEISMTPKVGGGSFSAHARAPFEREYVRFADTFAIPGRVRGHVVGMDSDVDPWLGFAPWRGEEARRFSALVASMGYQGVGASLDAPMFEVVDEAALRRACPDGGLAGYVGASAAAYVQASSHGLHHRPDPVLVRLMEVRRAVAGLSGGGDPEAAFELLRGYAELMERDTGLPEDPTGRFEPTMRARLMVVRHDEFERPYAGLDASGPDFDALAGFAR